MTPEKRSVLQVNLQYANLAVLVLTIGGVIWQGGEIAERVGANERRVERMEQADSKTDAATRIARLEERQMANDQRLAELRTDVKDIQQDIKNVSSKVDQVLAQLSHANRRGER